MAVKNRKALVVLSESEFISLLAQDPALWATALERGKALMRARRREAREAKAAQARDRPGR